MHLIHLGKTAPQNETSGGLRIKAFKKNFPILKGMSLYKLILHPGGVREPHWHPNADELGYCLRGSALVSLYGNYDLQETILVQQGEVFFIPSGFLHHIENVGEGNCELLLQFNHEDAEEFGISSALSFLSDSVLGNTWGVKKETLHALKRSTKPTFAGVRAAPPKIPESAKYASLYRYNLEKAQPLLTNVGGMAKMARQNIWPILKRQALYSLTLTNQGMREPHWHPETAELGYIQSGQGRMSILDPDGKVDTYEIGEGDAYFIPKAYPHHIENLGKGDLHILIFFDQPMPGDVGYSASIRSFSNEALGAALNGEPSYFEKLHKYYFDSFIVKRENPVE